MSTIPSYRFRDWLKPLVTSVIFGAVLYFLYHELHSLDFRKIIDQAENTPVYKIALSMLLMVLAYWVLTGYEVLAVRYAGASVPYPYAAFTALLSYAIGHNIGFASLSGGAMRYRMYSKVGLSGIQVALIILFGTVTFGLGAALLIGLSLLIEPADVLNAAGLSDILVETLASLLLFVVLLYCYWVFKNRKPLQFKQILIAPPSRITAMAQFITSSIDLILAASVLYVLLPDEYSVSFIAFLPLFMIGLGLSSLSSIPGGIGIFEAVMLIALPNIPKETLLSTILVYRVIYYLIPLGISLLGFIALEIGYKYKHVLALIDGTGNVLSSITPAITGIMVFIAGSVLLLSGATPAIDARLDVLKKFLPLALLELSHLLGSVCGIGLLILSRGLFKRLRGSYTVALVLVLLAIVMSLTKGVDYEEALLSLLAAIVLWLSRGSFYRTSSLLDEKFTPMWIVSLLVVIAASIWIGSVSYHHIEYRDQLWWQFAFNSNAPRMLRATLLVTIIFAGFLLWKLFHDAGVMKFDTDLKIDMDIIKKIIGQSADSQANLALTGDKRFLLHPEGDAFIMYQLSGNSWISMGDPVGNPERVEELAWQFRTCCDQCNAKPVFYQVSEKYLPLFVDMGLTLSKIGEEAIVPLTHFSLQGSARADFRQAVNRFKKLGATFEVIPSPCVATIVSELQSVSDEWLSDRSTHEKSFSLGAFSPEYIQHFDIAVIRLNGEIIAFANLWFSANQYELAIDLMRFKKTAPKGVMDYLFTEIMLWGREQGYQYFSLGMAPLSGLENHPLAPVWHKVGTLIFRYGENFYNFEGLRQYKSKFGPEWRGRYIASGPGFAMPMAILDVTRLVSGGLIKSITK